MTGQACAALWAPAADSYPSAPTFARAIADPATTWQAMLRDACVQLAYTFV